MSSLPVGILRQIRNATEDYIKNYVTVNMTSPKATSGTEINPGEEFTFDVSVTNSSDPVSVALKNLIWHIWIENSSDGKKVGSLKVPDASIAAARSHSVISKGDQLIPGSFCYDMYLFPPENERALGGFKAPTKKLSLRGRAESAVTKSAEINFEIIATIDMDWVFAQGEEYGNYPNIKKTQFKTQVLQVNG